MDTPICKSAYLKIHRYELPRVSYGDKSEAHAAMNSFKAAVELLESGVYNKTQVFSGVW